MNSMVRELETHVSRLFIEVTPAIRRALELLAEASITLLDEIDAPVDGCEADEDFEATFEDDEDGHDAEPEAEEPDLGWTEDGRIGGPNDWTGSGNDEDFVAPETSGGFPRDGELAYATRAEQKALFDPRITRRKGRDRFEITEGPDGRRWRIEGGGGLPSFPHDIPGRVPCMIHEEIRRLNKALAPRMRRRNKKRGKSNGN